MSSLNYYTTCENDTSCEKIIPNLIGCTKAPNNLIGCTKAPNYFEYLINTQETESFNVSIRTTKLHCLTDPSSCTYLSISHRIINLFNLCKYFTSKHSSYKISTNPKSLILTTLYIYNTSIQIIVFSISFNLSSCTYTEITITFSTNLLLQFLEYKCTISFNPFLDIPLILPNNISSNNISLNNTQCTLLTTYTSPIHKNIPIDDVVDNQTEKAKSTLPIWISIPGFPKWIFNDFKKWTKTPKFPKWINALKYTKSLAENLYKKIEKLKNLLIEIKKPEKDHKMIQNSIYSIVTEINKLLEIFRHCLEKPPNSDTYKGDFKKNLETLIIDLSIIENYLEENPIPNGEKFKQICIANNKLVCRIDDKKIEKSNLIPFLLFHDDRGKILHTCFHNANKAMTDLNNLTRKNEKQKNNLQKYLKDTQHPMFVTLEKFVIEFIEAKKRKNSHNQINNEDDDEDNVVEVDDNNDDNSDSNQNTQQPANIPTSTNKTSNPPKKQTVSQTTSIAGQQNSKTKKPVKNPVKKPVKNPVNTPSIKPNNPDTKPDRPKYIIQNAEQLPSGHGNREAAKAAKRDKKEERKQNNAEKKRIAENDIPHLVSINMKHFNVVDLNFTSFYNRGDECCGFIVFVISKPDKHGVSVTVIYAPMTVSSNCPVKELIGVTAMLRIRSFDSRINDFINNPNGHENGYYFVTLKKGGYKITKIPTNGSGSICPQFLKKTFDTDPLHPTTYKSTKYNLVVKQKDWSITKESTKLSFNNNSIVSSDPFYTYMEQDLENKIHDCSSEMDDYTESFRRISEYDISENDKIVPPNKNVSDRKNCKICKNKQPLFLVSKKQSLFSKSIQEQISTISESGKREDQTKCRHIFCTNKNCKRSHEPKQSCTDICYNTTDEDPSKNNLSNGTIKKRKDKFYSTLSKFKLIPENFPSLSEHPTVWDNKEEVQNWLNCLSDRCREVELQHGKYNQDKPPGNTVWNNKEDVEFLIKHLPFEFETISFNVGEFEGIFLPAGKPWRSDIYGDKFAFYKIEDKRAFVPNAAEIPYNVTIIWDECAFAFYKIEDKLVPNDGKIPIFPIPSFRDMSTVTVFLKKQRTYQTELDENRVKHTLDITHINPNTAPSTSIPEIDYYCKFGDNCRDKLKCNFSHEKRERKPISEICIECKFSDECNKVNCHFLHNDQICPCEGDVCKSKGLSSKERHHSKIFESRRCEPSKFCHKCKTENEGKMCDNPYCTFKHHGQKCSKHNKTICNFDPAKTHESMGKKGHTDKQKKPQKVKGSAKIDVNARTDVTSDEIVCDYEYNSILQHVEKYGVTSLTATQFDIYVEGSAKIDVNARTDVTSDEIVCDYDYDSILQSVEEYGITSLTTTQLDIYIDRI